MPVAPFFMRIVLVAILSCVLANCSKTEKYRYKLTLAMDTPEGVKRASSVVEVEFSEVLFPAKGTLHKLRGEALYLDLGANTHPLVALLTSRLHPNYGIDRGWSSEAGPTTTLLCQIYNLTQSVNFVDDIPQIATMRGKRSISVMDLPDIVTFSDVKDPSSVIEVDPMGIQSTLGSNITWHEITLEITDEPINTGIRAKLPWLQNYRDKMLDGSRYRDKNTLANALNTGAFDQSY